MKTHFIIKHKTNNKPITICRDWLISGLCWTMWFVVLGALVNGSEWHLLEVAFLTWMYAQEIFAGALLDCLHISKVYIGMVGVLMIGFVLWSFLNKALAPESRRLSTGPLALEDMASHFGVSCNQVRKMQREKMVMVFHSRSGAVTELRSMEAAPQAIL
ncbi:poly-beta-1,6-N-acetyl-D-glucosamine biosynthesis protein PgaD [Glaciimonas immobilis]|uniref:Poly-beta-1,6-N-acetyl-D-glucosamine biosynthesis protein PgaD n=1 Tax=Glaciimonas immobilis TaxID=728004 RepID=A0A840RX99_9BURK|nr:poly-beta-1,6-N-acetyl-D-glucosamine biosynthesis protein PgaD [Glaciimonas immobilis]KAF3996129.1 poly-beta-1,6-N-acetyl-D-glucosamine biosynthesis protein PgaD [Glaciimonas immobilis]MBB5201718.1 poly-beta-1,6-N-acetyl-D-glucosamine biosynthesis protein PgaD [Glaciimonas immobilis]